MDSPLQNGDDPVTQNPQETAAAEPSFNINIDIRKLVLSTFILWQIFAVAVWLLPNGYANYKLTPIVAPYLRITGFWQAWTMFSPNPMRDDYFVQAQIKYADGELKIWDIPRTSSMGMIDKYEKERFRKMIENAGAKSAKQMWPFLARYAMIENDRGPGTYPATVTVVRYWRYIVPPNTGWRTPEFAPQFLVSQKFNEPVLQAEGNP